jgi:hypothetical protein
VAHSAKIPYISTTRTNFQGNKKYLSKYFLGNDILPQLQKTFNPKHPPINLKQLITINLSAEQQFKRANS